MRDTYNGQDYAIGVIPYTITNDGVRYLIVHHTKGHRAFPKGHAEHGETMQETALRELAEETGVTDITLDDDIRSEHYTFEHKGVQVSKQVDYFMGYCEDLIDTSIQPEEVTEAKWCSYDEAMELMTFDAGKNLLYEVNEYIIENIDAYTSLSSGQ